MDKVITPPDNAEFVLIPTKWLPLLQSIARGAFIPVDYPIPIIVNETVPDNEIWFGKVDIASGNYEIVKKEITNEALKMLNVSSDPVDSDNSDGLQVSRVCESSRGHKHLR